ncbi:MAG: dihydropteroate synthase [Bacteroidota bacterium]
MFTLNCNGRLIKWEQPVVMGIINCTPDSFHSDSRVDNIDEALQKAGEMIALGAGILDIGGQSTRPGSVKIGSALEIERVIPIIDAIVNQFPETIISIDTYFSTVARIAVERGASIVNDVSAGLFDANMLDTVALLKVPYICMHHSGDAQQLHLPMTDNRTMEVVIDFFIERLTACKSAGIKDVIIDPGFGFGKTLETNFKLIRDLSSLKILGNPILLGVSRKSSIYKTLGGTAETALNGTTVLNTVGLMNGADILRVHDVKEAMEAIHLINLIKK